MPCRIFGDIPGIPEGSEFDNRLMLSQYGVHRPLQAGISGSQLEGADSIVLSGGYEDDEDLGDEIIYTGHGGRSLDTGQQVMDQELVRQNLALALNCQRGLPVRVIRGHNHNSPYSPTEGFRRRRGAVTTDYIELTLTGGSVADLDSTCGDFDW